MKCYKTAEGCTNHLGRGCPKINYVYLEHILLKQAGQIIYFVTVSGVVGAPLASGYVNTAPLIS